MERTATNSTQEFFDLWAETYKGTLGRFWETPGVGPAREKTEKVMAGMSTYSDFINAWSSSNAELQAVFAEASQRTQEKIGEGLVGELRPEGYKDFYKIWMDTYSETFNEHLKSEEFATDLGEVMSHWMNLQKFGRETMEEDLLKPLNLPTKAEIDEVNKELYELKRTVRESRRQAQSAANDLPSKVELEELRRSFNSLEVSVAEVAAAEQKATAKLEDKLVKLEATAKELKAENKDLSKQLSKLAPKKTSPKKAVPKGKGGSK